MDITRNEKGEINFFVCCILQSIFTLFDYKGFSYTLTQTSTSKDTFCAESSSAVLYLQPTHPNQTLSSCKNKRLTVPPIASVSISAFYEWIPSRIPKKDFIYIIKLKRALSLWDPTERCCSTLSLFPVQRGWRVEKPAVPCPAGCGVLLRVNERLWLPVSLFSMSCTLYFCQWLPHGLWFSLTSSFCHTHILTRTSRCDS